MEIRTLDNKRLSMILFAAVWLLYSLVYMTKNCYSAAMAAIVAEGALTKSQTGLITSVFYIIYAPLQIVGGSFADKYNPEKLMRIGLLGGAFANLVIFFNQSYPVMLIAWGLNAAAQFALWPAVLKIITTNLAHEHRTQGIFYITAASSAGVFISYTVAAFVGRWQNNFAISSAILFILAIFFYIVYGYMQKRMVPDADFKEASNKKIEQKISKRDILLKTGIMFIVPVCIIKEMLNTGVRAFSPVILMESYDHISPTLGNLMNLIIIAFGMIGIFIVKTFFYPKRIKSEFSGIILLFSAMIVPVGIAMFIGKIDATIMMLVLAVICGIVSSMAFFLNMFTMLFHKYGCDGMVAGILNASASFGIVIESYGFAAIAERMNWLAVIILWAIMCVAGIVLTVLGKKMWVQFMKKR